MTATSDFTLDTNILIYAIDRTDPAKHSVAERLLDAVADNGGVLLLQSLSEFYRATTKKRLIEHSLAESTVRAAMQFATVVPPDSADLLTAISLHQLHNLQFFDALLLATAARAGCTTLFSEDFQHGRTYASPPYATLFS